VSEKGKQGRRHSKKESKFHRDREKDKMRYTMGLKDSSTETFIFMKNGNMIKVVINFNRKMCIVYSAQGRTLMKIENMSSISMLVFRNQLNKYIADGKRLRGFRPPPGIGYL
jgi:hypothetical protein